MKPILVDLSLRLLMQAIRMRKVAWRAGMITQALALFRPAEQQLIDVLLDQGKWWHTAFPLTGGLVHGVDRYLWERENLVGFLADDCSQIANSASVFIARLNNVCSNESVSQRWKTIFVLNENGTSVELSSPFGEAWADLAFGIEGNQLLGLWNIWKVIRNQQGEKKSSLVATIRFSRDGEYRLGSLSDASMNVRQQGTGNDITAHRVMASILYAIGDHRD